MTAGDYILRKRECSAPYKNVSEAGEDHKNVRDLGGEATWVNPNPENKPEDPGAVVGSLIFIPFQKTCYKYDLYIFLDQTDEVLAKCYWIVRNGKIGEPKTEEDFRKAFFTTAKARDLTS